MRQTKRFCDALRVVSTPIGFTFHAIGHSTVAYFLTVISDQTFSNLQWEKHFLKEIHQVCSINNVKACSFCQKYQYLGQLFSNDFGSGTFNCINFNGVTRCGPKWHLLRFSGTRLVPTYSMKKNVSCPCCFLYAFYWATVVLRTSRSTLRYAFACIRVLRAYYAMFVSFYASW